MLLLMVSLASLLLMPTAANAFWQFEEVPISGETFELHGASRYQSELGGVECTVQVDVTLEPGTTTAKASQFGVKESTKECKGSGALAFCQVHGITYSGLPLTLHITETTPPTIAITTGDVQYTTTGGFCPVSTITLTAGTVTATADNPNAMKTVTMSGSLTADSTTSGGTVDKNTATVSGDLKVTPEGIYGI
jgi:lipopolysaccharide export system protein LptA